MDSEKSGTVLQSSHLVHPITILFWLVVCFSSALAGYTPLAVFSGFVFVLSLCALLWGRLSLRGVRYELTVPRSGLFPGQSVTLTRTIYNGKLLPLLWLELFEPCDPDGPAVPDSGLIVPTPDVSSYDSLEAPAEEPPGDRWRCLYSFSLLKWHQALTFSDAWQAQRRGIHRIREVTVRSGDGFSLSAISRTLRLGATRQIVVYPRLTDVSVDAILNDIWDSRSASRGHLEDVTLLKSVRDYTARDPARRINQRLLARGGGLKVNQYEVVTPSDVLFILDAASFRGQVGEPFELALSILGSLITGLSRRGIHVGLLAPRSVYAPQTCIEPSSNEMELLRMLELLAGVSQDNPPLKAARSDYPVPERLGQAYYVTYSESAATSLQILAHFPPHKAQLLTFLATESSADSQALRARAITEFWRV